MDSSSKNPHTSRRLEMRLPLKLLYWLHHEILELQTIMLLTSYGFYIAYLGLIKGINLRDRPMLRALFDIPDFYYIIFLAGTALLFISGHFFKRRNMRAIGAWFSFVWWAYLAGGIFATDIVSFAWILYVILSLSSVLIYLRLRVMEEIDLCYGCPIADLFNTLKTK